MSHVYARRMNGFGAVGLKGENCPVPQPDDWMGYGFKPQTHDKWCDCMYSSNRLLLARCKWKLADTYRNPEDPAYDGKVLFDPSMPWNLTGSRSRGLIEDGLTNALNWARAKIEAGLNPGAGGVAPTEAPPATKEEPQAGGNGAVLAAGALLAAKLLKLF